MYWLGDGLIRIKNAILTKKEYVVLKRTNLLINVLNVLKKEGLIYDYVLQEDGVKVDLAYYKNSSVIENIKLISTPSYKIYSSYKDLMKYIKKFSCVVVSTSKGVLSGKEAYERKLGGKVLCEVC